MEREDADVEKAEHASLDGDAAREHDDLTIEQGALSGARSPFPAPASVLVPRLSRQSRLRRLAATAGVLALALVLLFGASPALRANLGGVFVPQPTATATTPLLPGQDQFYLDADVPWSSVTLDGHALRLPQIGRDAPLRLARGTHHLAWRAAPFQLQSCVLTVPPRFGDTCPVAAGLGGQPIRPPQPTGTAVPDVQAFARILQVRESLATLPPDQAQALQAAMRQSVAAFEDTVQPGERYLAGPSGIAKQPLRATLTFTLEVTSDPHSGNMLLPCWLDGAPFSGCVLTGHDCALLCTIPWQARQASPRSTSTWLAFVLALPTWTYSTLDGRVLAQGQPLEPAGAAGNANLLILFSISWDGAQWQAVPLIGPGAPPVLDDSDSIVIPPMCVPAQDALQGDSPYFTQVRYISAPNPAEGCLAVATLNPNTAPPGLVSLLARGTTTAQFLSRFGLLVPLDAAARIIEPWPGTPTANELSLAQQLAEYPGVICTLHGVAGC